MVNAHPWGEKLEMAGAPPAPPAPPVPPPVEPPADEVLEHAVA
jgi:hypothetical protein